MTHYSDIEDSIRIEEVLDELGINTLYVHRSEHWTNCPLPSHPGNDASPSFSVNENNLLWNCFTCGEGGALPGLVIAMEGFEDIVIDGETVSRAWDQAVEWLTPFSDGPTSTDDGFLRQIESLLQAPIHRPTKPRRHTLPFMSDRGYSALSVPPAALLEPWNLTVATAEHWGLKYDSNRRRIKQGEEHFGPAIIIPHCFNGELVGWQERWLGDRPDWLPKYTNTEDFPKALTLWGYDNARFYRHSNVLSDVRIGTPTPVVVVESAMTVMRIWQEGYPAVGTFGTGISDVQIKLLRSFVNGLWVALDNDPDYINTMGRVVKGAGYKARDMLVEELCDYVPLEVVAMAAKSKGDLADVDTEELHRLLADRKAGFLLRATPKRQ